MTIKELREKRTKAWDEARNFLDSKRTDSGLLSEEDAATYDKMEADVVNLGKEIQRLERQAQLDAQLNAPTSQPVLSAPHVQIEQTKRTGTASAAYSKAFWNSIRNRNFADIRNDLQIGEDTEGGFLVPFIFNILCNDAIVLAL